MEHLTTFDSVFLDAEDSDRHVSLAVGGVSVIEGPMPDYQSIEAVISERILAVPRLRQVLRTHALDLSAPQWVADPKFALAHHLHRAALPRPGGDAELLGFAAEVMERRLDRDRPLWECWIVDGLSEGRWALLMKLHHCIADGIAAMHIVAALSDDGEGETFASAIRGAHEPPDAPLGPPLGLNPLRWPNGMWRLASGATSAAVRAVEGAIEIAAAVIPPTAGSSLTGPVTAMRRYSAARVSLQDVEKVSARFNVTLNDVALAAITYSFRSMLIRRGELPRRHSLRTLVPVSVRATDAVAAGGNRVSLMLPFLPVEKHDPVEQLRAVHIRMTRAKTSGQREAGGVFVAALNAVPFAVTAWVARALTRLPQRNVVTLATNVPGPRHRLRIMDREVLHVLPIPPIALGLRTGIAILSYADDLTFGITGDYDTVPDVDELARGIQRAVTRLVALSSG